MKHRVIIGLVILAVLVAGAFVWHSDLIFQKVVFTCDSGKNVEATFLLHRNGVNIKLSDGRSYRLAKFIYNSEATSYIYSPDGDQKNGYVQFLNKGDMAWITEKTAEKGAEEEETFSNCRASDFGGVAEQNRRESPPKFSWTLYPQGGLTKVILNSADTPSLYFGGAYPGNCFEVKDSAWKLLPNEVTGVVCLDAGKGIEVGVFKNDQGKYVARVGVVKGGTLQTPGTRDGFSNEHPLYLY